MKPFNCTIAMALATATNDAAERTTEKAIK